MNDMRERILDKNWPWVALSVVLFTGAMTFLHWMTRGFGVDFGMGFAIGGTIGIFIALFAVGWHRGEMAQEVDALSPERDSELLLPQDSEEYPRQIGSGRQR